MRKAKIFHISLQPLIQGKEKQFLRTVNREPLKEKRDRRENSRKRAV